MIRVSDYIIQEIAKYTNRVFLVTGGGAMHLNDAIGRNKNVEYVCMHHEQSCAIAAESYSRITGKLGVVNVTSGPGGINAINGVFGAWVDSIPMLVVSGQVKRETCVSTYGLTGKLRQLGDQEADIINMVDGITKYAVFVNDPLKIRYHVEKAIYLALNGRPGPCWLDIPIDVQASLIDPEKLGGYDNAEDELQFNEPEITEQINSLITLISEAERPVVYAGSGIHHSKTYEQFFKLIDLLGIPVVTAWNSNDLLPDSHPLYAGRPGIIGNRAGNFTVQNADLLLVLGSRLNIRLVSYNWENFARNAYKVCVDIDSIEMEKPTCRFDMKINTDLRLFFKLFLKQAGNTNFPARQDWVNWCKERVAKYPVCLPEYWSLPDLVNPYCFVDEMSKHLKEDEVVVCADGTACVVTFQGVRVKKGQRIFHNSGCASMGYDLPAAVGAYYSGPKTNRIICIAGDGSIMMNIQELQTIGGGKLPLQIFVFNNKGYHSIRQTQHNFFKDNIVGCGLDSGLSFPDFEKIAAAFDLGYFSIKNHDELKANLGTIMGGDMPFICEVFLTLDQEFSPKLSSKKLDNGTMISSPLEDMYPFLPADELQSNMLKSIKIHNN
ncbi:thiamine pyrophosphate-binding protein [Mucilaginibacter mali]|uniref:Thiamine pyrophosphate-binding protein n=1 Tax=Mucilaginibacter mali TaxID=2740462 RepID=A0A7D4QM30_9SPHI|nr:thiamine pyrophosphate-binding protein [Mucilaginibacter mali]QKJ31490.1 thiamine pyrophosphate-binding protein [Mucilaginibacter mali]